MQIKKKFLLLFFVSSLFMTSCSQNKQMEQAKFHDDGRVKPMIAIYPLVDTSEHQLKWSLSHELNAALNTAIKKSDKLYLTNVDSFLRESFSLKHLFRKSIDFNFFF